jgi:hypothetical protein
MTGRAARTSRRVERPAGVTTLLTAAVVATAGCGDDGVRMRGTIAGQPVLAVGTVAAWVDRTGYIVDGEGAPVLADRPATASVLHLRFFEAVFDPAVSFEALSPAARAALQDRIARGDAVSVDVGRGVALRAGDRITAAEDGAIPEVLPWVAGASVALRTEVDAGSDYPEELPVADVAATTATLKAHAVAPRLEGTIELTFDDDELVVDFAATLLPERTAECNFAREAAGIVDACTLAPVTPDP